MMLPGVGTGLFDVCMRPTCGRLGGLRDIPESSGFTRTGASRSSGPPLSERALEGPGLAADLRWVKTGGERRVLRRPHTPPPPPPADR